MSSALTVGQPAPDFTLTGWAHGEQSDYTLSVRRGQPVVLAFYPADNSLVCTKQMCSYSDNVEVFDGLNAVVWGISGQDLDSKKAFADKRSLKLPLLVDSDNTVAKAYGIHSKLGPKRSVFVIDSAGKIAWSHVATLGVTFQSTEKIAEVLKGLHASS